ncbi:MAG: ParB/RepB/Spo0J family partition protein [Ignavibacteriales bacterium]|nr:MAG: ParB/RepB/Spo0J family partition protein [Ignavibacteriales bacterium]
MDQVNKLRPGLGRGLDALISPNLKSSDQNLTVSAKSIKPDDGQSYEILVKIPVSAINPNPYQPRTNFDPEALDELKKSILSNGLIQPITVRRAGYQKYELISGERRLRACKDIGYKEIPAYIIKVETKEAMLALSLIENIQREKLNPIEIAIAYRRLLDECNMSHEMIAEQVGKDRTTITNQIRLLKLPKEIQDYLIKEEISTGHARALINLPGEKLQLEIVHKIIEENLSVRKVENLVKKYLAQGNTQRSVKINTAASNLQNLSQKDIEDKLRKIFGTKVICKQKSGGSGEIVIEFYSNDELERLFELFDILEKGYN